MKISVAQKLAVELFVVFHIWTWGNATAQETPVPSVEKPGGSGLFDTIHVIVGPAAKELDPMAIQNVRCAGGNKKVCAKVDEVLSGNMSISGFFKVLPKESFIADPDKERLQQTNYSDWFNIGAKYLIKGEVVSAGDKHSIEFRLYNVFEKKEFPVKKQSFKNISSKEVVKAVHEFANSAIEAITGKPGVFGTTILFAGVSGKWVKEIFGLTVGDNKPYKIISNGNINLFPKFAPGGEVLYTSFIDGKPDLFVGKKKITKDEIHYRGAAFSPDGSRIAASADSDGQADIFLIDPATGKILKNLTNNPADDVSPSWSPDGSKIAFVSNRSGGPQIFVMGADGSEQRRLTMAGTYNSTPDFGKNGLIVFAGMDEYKSDIFTVDLSGNIARLTQDQGNNKDPTWSPDGRFIAFFSNRDGGWKLFIMTDDGRWQFPLMEHGGAYSTPSWGF